MLSLLYTYTCWRDSQAHQHLQISIIHVSAVADDVGHGFSHSQCLHRWFNSTNPAIKKGRWSEEEDEVTKCIHVDENTFYMYTCTWCTHLYNHVCA